MEPHVAEPVHGVHPHNVDLDEDAPEDEEEEEEDGVDVLEDGPTREPMMEVQPAQLHERSRDFQENEGRTHRHCEVLLPERDVVVREGNQVVQQRLLVDWCVDSDKEEDKEGVDDKVRSREEAKVNMTVARH